MNFDAECSASADLALAIAAALGLPGLGRMMRLSIDFRPNEPAVVTAEFSADPALLAAGLADARHFKLVPVESATQQEARDAA